MPWTDDDLRKSFQHDPEKGDAMVQARQVMGTFLMAVQSGTVQHFHPSPGCSFAPEYVAEAIEAVDKRWDIEFRTRGQQKGYGRSAEFGRRLSTEQQMAMLQQLRVAMGKKPTADDS